MKASARATTSISGKFMKLAVPKETRPGETRVAISLEAIKKFADLGIDVVVESGAGDAAAMPDAALKARE